MKLISFRRYLYRRASRLFLSIAVLGVAFLVTYNYIQTNLQFSRTRDELILSAQKQINTILPGILLPEQADGVALHLAKIKGEEDLSDILIVPEITQPAAGSAICSTSSENIFVCRPSVNKVTVSVPLLSGGKNFGFLFKAKSIETRGATANIGSYVAISFILLLCGFLGSILLILRIASKEVPSEIQKLLQTIDHNLSSDVVLNKSVFEFRELQDLSEAISRLIDQSRYHRKSAYIAELASQVAHDIRSPLAALQSAEKDLAKLPEETRVLIRAALNRIKDIANNLLQKNRPDPSVLRDESQGGSCLDESFQVELLPSLLDVIMSEKRLQYRSQIGVEIEAVLDKGSYGIFSKIEPVEFKRVISNLINNSVEALTDGKGRVVVELGRQDGFAAITVRDNGKGIPSDILPKLMQNGSSFGKKSGSGLGLYHAKKSLQSWGGDLVLSSEVGVGTAVVMTLPLAEAPTWFVEKLTLNSGQKIIVLDDDASIHQIWLGRFESAGLKAEGIEVLHFSTPEKIQEYLDQNKSKKLTFLMDYELLGSQLTGLDVIEKNQLGSQAILVTSRFEEPGIRDRCQRLKTKLIPKGMVAFVPIEVVQAKLMFDGIVIDDDPLVHLSWQARAKAINKSIKSYSRAADFIHVSDQVDPETPVYIDSNLGPGVSGEEVAQTLNTKGFQNIFIASGYEPEKFEHLKFLKGVIGKTPPF